MEQRKATAVDKADGASKTEQASTMSKDVIRRRRANIKMVQNVLLVWLNNSMDDYSADCRNTMSQLRCV